MDDYVEDYSYNNNFWNKSGVLYSHFRSKFNEFFSLGIIFHKLANMSNEFSQCILKVKTITDKIDVDYEKNKEKKKKGDLEQENYYYPLSPPDNSTRSGGIKTLFEYFDRLSKCFMNLNETFKRISKDIFDQKTGFDTKVTYEKDCDEKQKTYQEALLKLNGKKEVYFDSINKAIEYHLSHLGKPNKNKEKYVKDVNKKRNEYLAQVKAVENIRVEYVDLQGHVFAIMEEFERNCTNDLKASLKNLIKSMDTIQKDIGFTEKEKKQIEEMDGSKDNQQFSEQNKSLITGPKRNLFIEYSQDMSHYMENFEFMKKETKSKTSKELKEYQKYISQEVTKFLNEIIIEEKNEVIDRILKISKNLKESKLSKEEFDYLITKFDERFNRYLKWKQTNNINSQNYKKVGEEYDDRYVYMQTFLGYFNKTRVENKCLDEENFNYFCKAVEKILELNMNEDIDYSLCDLVVILSSTFYMVDESKKSGKKYINEVIKNCPIMQKHGFWVGLTKFELNQEIQQQKTELDTLSEVTMPSEKLNNSIVAKLMSISYNLMQFIKDSTVFNKVVYDIFKHCKINKDNRNMIVTMMEQQIQSENLTYITLDKDLILSDL